MPAVIFLPDTYYDYRIWADIPSGLGEHYDIVHYDRCEPVPWASPETFIPALRRLIPDDRRTVVVAAGYAAGFAVRAALSGLAAGLALFQPAPDYRPPEVLSDVPIEDLIQAAAPYAGLIEATRETDPARRSELVIRTWRGIYGEGLPEADVSLASEVIGDHVEELLAAIAETVTAAETGARPPRPGPPWVGQLGDVTTPVTVVTSRRANPVGEAIAKRIPAGRFVAARAHTDLPWLEDRAGALSVLRQMLAECRR